MLTRVLLCLLFAVPSWTQPAATGSAETTGSCSPAVSGSTNQFVINCPGLGPEQGKKMLAILNKILANQLDPNLVMAKLDEIGKDVKKLGRGIYSGYDFNGTKRDDRPGLSVVTLGAEGEVFQKIMQLDHEKRWSELLMITEDQIKNTPSWLTPYLFSGIANANLGNKSAAIDRLKFVHEEAAGDPDYADADRILRLLQQ